MRRGELYWADLVPRSGSEQTGRRPVLIVSSDFHNAVPGWRSFIVVPISTSASQAARGPTSVPLRKGVGGLAHDSLALCHQMTTLDRGKLSDLIGVLPGEDLSRVDEGLQCAMDLPMYYNPS